MAYRSIALCIEHEDAIESVVKTAVSIADTDRSHFSALHSVPQSAVNPQISPFISPEKIREISLHHRERAQTMKRMFESAMSDTNIQWEWKEFTGQTMFETQPYIKEALVSDIVVTSRQYDSGGVDGCNRNLLMGSGVPMLIVPAGSSGGLKPCRVMLAWNSTAEAARAARDALPVLKAADIVDVVEVSDTIALPENSSASANDLVSHLQRHGVTARPTLLKESHINAGHTILKLAEEMNTDLLVMGGFGHSRLYDAIVGAATGTVIEHMKLPVLLSH